MIKTIEAGRVVYSTAGHDKGKKYIVLKALDNGFALVTDGKSHKMDNPKRKNIKHLNTCDKVFDEIDIKSDKNKLNNSVILNWLAGLEKR